MATSDDDHEPDSLHGNTQEVDLERSQSAKSVMDTLPLYRELLFVGIISCAQFTTQAGLGQCLSIIYVIGDHFGISNNAGKLSWIIAAYSLTVGTFILVAGRFGDLFGYKRMVVIGYSWFSLWSLVAGCAYYSNHILFNFARVLQGIGPAILLPNGIAILGASYKPSPRKNMVFAVFGATAPAGATVGALFSALFNLTFWPWAFWSFSITLACLAVATYIFVPDPPVRPSPKGDHNLTRIIKQLDLLGGTVGIVGLVLFNFAWNQAGVVSWPAEPYLWVTLILGVLVIATFFVIEIKISSHPLLPFDAFTANVGFVLACIACGWGCFGVWVYYLWNFFLVLRHATPLQATAWTVPVIISGGTAAIVTGFLLSRIRPAYVMLMAMTAFCVGVILIATAPIEQNYWAQAFVCTIVTPFGMDLSFPSGTVILSNSVKKEHQGIAASLVATVVNYSISLALGFAGTVEMNVAEGDSLKGFRSAWYLAIGLSGMGIVISLLFVVKTHLEEKREDAR